VKRTPTRPQRESVEVPTTSPPAAQLPLRPPFGSRDRRARAFWAGLTARSGPGATEVTRAAIGDRFEQAARTPTTSAALGMLTRLMAFDLTTTRRGPLPWPVRPMSEEEYPPELTQRMEALEPQFTLRNVPRVEYYADEELELDRSQGWQRDRMALLDEIRMQRYRPPALFAEQALEEIRAYRRRIRQLFLQMPWERHFCRELKEELAERRIALWNYDPEAPLDARIDGTVATMPARR